ncbi:MAG: aminotransferase class V-fold PLP-dependent enzyme [Bacteroidetes bacterium]|jgi:glutamate/tyrosine decarboxylase-like PLP-dependent enzyme|nr:aminotransferase class V-fold PLP-dependent enzyme [Bacteroidota bacterium]MDF1866085.1 aminotransferase class V-fold PLP-dependent enzyme [Saprospiraceae bacterium]
MKNIRTEMFSEMEGKELFEQAKDYAYEYSNSIRNQPVFPEKETIEGLNSFDEPLSKTGCSGEVILKQLHQFGSPATVAQTGGRYFGFVNGNSIPAALATKWLSDFWDQNSALYVMSPINSKLESVCENWLKELFQFPSETVAGFVSGTTMANLVGLAAARYRIFKNKNWDVNEKGLFGAPKIRVVLGAQAHSSVIKTLTLLGFGKENLELVPVDSQGRMDASQLPKLDDQTILITQAGNVNSGAFDPFEAIFEAIGDAGTWVHVDGAFGLWAAGSEKQKHLTKGVENANSWSVDGHKTLNAPYDSGIILCQDKDALFAAMQASGSYLQYSENRDGMLYTPEMSRRARAIELWAALKYLGKSGVGELVNGLCQRAQQFADELSKAGFRILNEVVFNQVLVAGENAEETARILQNIQSSGECWCGGATWFDEPIIRISVCSWATTEEDISRSVQAFMNARNKVY